MFYFLEDIKEKVIYNPNFEYKSYLSEFKNLGQLKLFFTELRFLVEDVKIQNLKDDIIILYIGSGKGFHIPYLIKLFENFNITWILYDPSGHCDLLNKINKYKKNIEIYDEFFTKSSCEYIKSLIKINKKNKLLLISDFRTSEEKEPKTKDLLKDYEFQNFILQSLNPDFSLIKMRLPFPDNWSKEDSFYFPIGTNYIQPFTKNFSTEFRIFLKKNIVFKKINYEDIDFLKDIEEKFFWYNINRNDHKNDIKIMINNLKNYNKEILKKDFKIKEDYKYIIKKIISNFYNVYNNYK